MVVVFGVLRVRDDSQISARQYPSWLTDPHLLSTICHRSYQITVYIQRVNKAFCIFNYYVQYLCNYGCSLLQFWSMIVCTQASIGSSLRNYIPLLSNVHLDSPGQKPYCLFFIRASPGKWYNGMHSSRTILSILDFLNHFILVKCKYLCTKLCLYHLLLAVLLLKSKGKYCYLFMQLLL